MTTSGRASILVLGPPGADAAAVGSFFEELGFAVVGPRVGEGASPAEDATVDADLAAFAGAPGRMLPALSRDDPDAIAAVLVWRAPQATVDALAAEGVVPAHALALWEAHLVEALHVASGHPFLGLDLDPDVEPDVDSDPEINRFDAVAALSDFLATLGHVVPGETLDPGRVAALVGPDPPASGRALGDRPGDGSELEALTKVIRARLAPVLASALGAHDRWVVPEGLAVGPTSAALLAAHLAAHRAALDEAAAWAVTHEARLEAQDAKEAVEREHRELVGPDPIHYAELRRELWRLRDELAGAVAARAQERTGRMRAEAAQLAAEARVTDLSARLDDRAAEVEHLHVERTEILESERWRVGGAVVNPLVRLRRWFSRR